MKSRLPAPLRAAIDRAAASFAAFESDAAVNLSDIAATDTFKTRLRSQGKTIRQWAEENGFPPGAVYRVLNGIDKAHFGRAHDIAVKAGIKPDPDQRLAA